MEAAGLGLGVLPLGSKVYNEIKAYVDSVKNADSETLAILDHINDGRELMELLAAVVNKNGPTNQRLERHLAKKFAGIQKELNAANLVIAKLRGLKDDQAIEKSESTTQDVLKPLSRTRTAFYHWRRDELKNLEPQLNRINGQFDRVLQIYGIYSTSSFQDQTNDQFVTVKESLTTITKLLSPPQPAAAIDQRVAGPSIPSLQTSRCLTWTSIDSVKTLVDDSPEHEESSVCRCRPKHQVKGASGGTRWLSLYKQQKTTVAHDVGCPYYGLEDLQTEHTYTVTVNGRHFWDRLSTVVAFTVNKPTSRFGSWAISPQMKTYNMVDLAQSPATRLFHLADDLDDIDWDDPAVEKKTRSYWHQRLLELFRTGKASPFDVDYRTKRPMLHFLQLQSRNKMGPYLRLTWDTLHQLNFPEHMSTCDGLKPWAYYFSKSDPLNGTRLNAEALPWNMERWLEPEDIPESLLGSLTGADLALSRAFILAVIMHERRSLLEASNIGVLCQAIILRSMPKVLEILDDNVSSWNEPFLSDEGGICAIDLAIMWFPELMNALLQGDANTDSRLGRLSLPRPNPSKHSFLEVAVNIGLQHGERHGKSTTQEYISLIDLALTKDYPIYFHRISLHLAGAEEMITAHLADRRRRLLELAKRRLRTTSDHLTGIFESKFVDEKVEDILQAFAAAEVPIPEGLKPRDLEDQQQLSGSIFEYAWHSEALCDRLQELGFDPEGFVRSRCRDGPFLMAPLMSPKVWDSWRFIWLENLVSESKIELGLTHIAYGESPRQPPSPRGLAKCTDESTLEGPSLLYALMAYVGHCMPGNRWEGFRFPEAYITDYVKPHILASVEDDCICSCTVSGCRPLMAFVRPVLMGRHQDHDTQLYLDRVTYCFQLLEIIFDEDPIPKEATLGVLRICTFECLWCRHTCCTENTDDYIFGWSKKWPWAKYDDEDRREIHEEDEEKLQALETFLAQTEMELNERDWDALDFVKSRWMPAIRKTMQERQEMTLTVLEIERIKDVGVEWEEVVTQQEDKSSWDDDADSAISLSWHHLETDEDRMKAIMITIDDICT